MKRIHCLNNISKTALSMLPEDVEVVSVLSGADAILVRSAVMHELELPETVLAVARAGAGVNNIPLEKYGKQGVVVFNTPGANANAVKELTIAGMLLASRDIIGGVNWLTENKKDPDIAKSVEKNKSQFGGTEIFGKTIGIIGLGAIGLLIEKACLALGMKVLATERDQATLDAKRFAVSTETELVPSIEDLIPRVDFLSLNLPLSKETSKMFNKSLFSKMKDGVILLNFARDGLVNDADLSDAISSGKIRKYVTDFPNPETANMDGVIAIPHLGASTEESEENCATMAVHQVLEYLIHGNIINSVNYPNTSLGNKQSESRIVFLHDASLEIKETIERMMAECATVFRSLSNEYGKFACTMFDSTRVDFETLEKKRENLPGIHKIRVL